MSDTRDVKRTTVGAPRDAEWYASGAWMLKHLTAVEARETFSKVLEKDPAAFMAAIAKEA